MIKKAISKGDTVEHMCSVCDLPQMHTVVKATKQGAISEAVCEACQTVSTYVRGTKTSVSTGTGKIAAPYDRGRSYRKGQAMTHDKFGRGEVLDVEGQKMDVLFGDEVRRMIHNQS